MDSINGSESGNPKPTKSGKFKPTLTLVGDFRQFIISNDNESLTIIEESLIAQGEPVENLSKTLPELYQKSQELQESVNALSQRFGSFEEYLTSLNRNMTQLSNKAKMSAIELVVWRTLAIVGITGTVISILYRFSEH